MSKGNGNGHAQPLIDSVTPWERDDRCWYVVACHPGGLNYAQVGELIGTCASRVFQIERRALRELRLRAPRLAEALEAAREARRDRYDRWDDVAVMEWGEK